jgi:inward rectifier potassium channel
VSCLRDPTPLCKEPEASFDVIDTRTYQTSNGEVPLLSDSSPVSAAKPMTTDETSPVAQETRHRKTAGSFEPVDRLGTRANVARVRVGSYEFKKKGVSRFDVRDPYHLAIALSWPQFLVLLLALYLVMNVAFAVSFWLVPGSVGGARPGRFLDDFFFSIETVATVGYGEMHPASLYGHLVASIEIVCGLAFTAILTGLTFVRFSRPRAKLIFAANPVVAMHHDKPTLMVRIGNGRPAALTDAAARLSVLLSERSADGQVIRRAQELRLERAHLPIFPLSWTLMHVLGEKSPLRGYDAARTIEANAQVFVTIEARDPMLSTTVHDLRSYPASEIRFGMRYSDALTAEKDGTIVLDMTRIGALEPDVGDSQESGWSEREADT